MVKLCVRRNMVTELLFDCVRVCQASVAAVIEAIRRWHSVGAIIRTEKRYTENDGRGMSKNKVNEKYGFDFDLMVALL